jgi:hypothetical protein
MAPSSEYLPGGGLAIRERLLHVLWLGGSACSGKTAVAERLSAGYGLAVYCTDEAFARHRRNADPLRQAVFCRVGDRRGDELWGPPAGEQAADLLAFHREHFTLVLDDLLQVPQEAPLLVAGSCLLPECVAPMLSSPRRALWLVGTAEFRRLQYGERGGLVRGALAGCSDPAAAFERWMARDDALADWRAAELRRLGLRWLNVDGQVGLDEMTAQAAEHFGLAALRPVVALGGVDRV